MAANVLFKVLTEAQWANLSTKDNGTFYRVQKTGGGEDFYQGSNKLNGAAGEIEAAIAALDTVSDVGIASKTGKIVSIAAGISETDGIIGAGSGTAIELAGVASTGNAEDLVYDPTTSGLTATDAQSAIDEVVGGLGTAAAADVATTAIQESSTDDSLVSAAQVSAFVATEIAGLTGAMHFVGVITRQTGETDAQAIARVVTSPESGDVVVMSDNAKEYVYDGTAWREVGDETEFVKKTTTIAGVDLEDNITATELRTALNVADGAQANVIESVKVNGSALTPDANKAVDVLIAEGSVDKAISVNGSSVAVHGLGSASLADTTDFDAAGAAAAVVGQSGDAASAQTVFGSKAYADSLAVNYDPAGSSATAEQNAKDYTDGLLTWEVVSGS